MDLSARLICRKIRSSFWSRSAAHTLSTLPGKSVIHSPYKIQNSASPPPPCLMLPPELDNDTGSVGFKSYSLAEKRVQTLPQTSTELKDLMPEPIHDLWFCGSSHGWIGMLNPRTHIPFIYNPISLRHINLPSIQNLPNHPKADEGSVYKLILSCSPDHQNCRAVIIYDIKAVAFCCLGRSEWIPIGKTRLFQGTEVWSSYLDFVYSTTHDLFFGLTQFFELETWDLTHPSSPRLIKTIDTDKDKYFSVLPNIPNDTFFVPVSTNLVVVEDHVLLVTRYAIEDVAPDGTYTEDRSYPSRLFPFYPHMTIGFRVDVYDPHKNDDILTTGLDTLGDLALFIGTCSDSVVLSATEYPELKLKSNSIYFTDQYMERTESIFKDRRFGGHDIGIFDFKNKTVSPCYYPCDLPSLKRIAPSPMWFFPRD